MLTQYAPRFTITPSVCRAAPRMTPLNVAFSPSPITTSASTQARADVAAMTFGSDVKIFGICEVRGAAGSIRQKKAKG